MRQLLNTLKMLGCFIVTAPIGGALIAHEFWIDPVAFQLPIGAPLVADIRVGQDFSGAAYAYLPPQFRRFDLITSQGTQTVPGRPGDRPALNMPTTATGLSVAVHVTTDSTLTYREWDKFNAFVTHKDFAWAAADHLRRGLPETGFKERYSRYAKSLLAVGDGAGKDREIGLVTELVALTNPYTDDLSQGMVLRAYYQGAPRADVQIEVFEKNDDGSVQTTLHRTDDTGLVRVPVRAGYRYMADAVVMRPLDAATSGGAVWESLWASLTFEVPD